MKHIIASQSPKALRMSAVALSAAVMAVVWGIFDELSSGGTNPVIVSSITALVMLVAQFIDVKAKKDGSEVFEGEPE